MKRIITIVFVFFNFTGLNVAYSQNCNPAAADICFDANVLCGLAELDGYACSNPTESNPTGPFPTLCFGQGVAHNTNWWAFIGNGEQIQVTFEFDPSDCEFAGTSCNGIQAGIIFDCVGAPLDCDAACNTGTFTLGGQTTNCHTYYVWVDGCCGDVCNYEISVGKGRVAKIPQPLPDFYVEGEVCPCNTVDVCIGPLEGGCETPIRWTIDGVEAPSWDDEMCITGFDVPANPVEFCVTWILGNPGNPDAICDEQTKCFTLVPKSKDVRPRPPLDVCWEDHQGQYTWSFKGEDTTIFTSCIDPPCSLAVQEGSGCCVLYTKEIRLLEERPKGERWKFNCDRTPFVAENGRVFRQPECGVEVTWKAPWGPNSTLCDTTYILYFDTYNPDVETKQSCGTCQGYVEVTADFEWFPECANGDVTETPFWVTPNLDTIWDQNFEVHFEDGDPPGKYEFFIKVDYVDPDDPLESKICYFQPGKFEIIKPVSVPRPILEGDSPLCFGTEGQYRIINDLGDVCMYAWTIKQGNGQIITNNSETSKEITVFWDRGAGNVGIVCVNALVDCGKSKDTCFTVELQESPAPDAGPDTVLCGLSYTMRGTADVAGGKWQIINQAGNVNFDPNDIKTSVSVDDYGTYTFEWSESLSTCEGKDSVTVLFRPDPDHGPVDTICAGDAKSYRIQFDILNGEGPYEIVEGTGTISGDHYLSDTIYDNVLHHIVIRDKYGCEFIYEITHECVCPNQLGVVAKDTIKECGVTTVKIQYDNTGEVLGPQDVVDYVLFTAPGTYYQTMIARNSTGEFTFDPNTMQYGKIYYLGVILGKGKGDGTVDELGGCLQRDFHPVIWYEIPRPDAGPEQSICGLEIDLSGVQSLTGSQVEWLNTPGVVFSDSKSTSPHITAANYGRYVFYFQETNVICPEVDSTVVNFNESPEIVSLKKICLDRDPQFRWYYEVCITKGKSDYTLLQGNGTLDKSTWCFRSNNLSSNTTDILEVEDANGCRAMIPVSHNCDCGLTAAGTMDQSEVHTCVDQCVTVMANNDHVGEPDDCVKMILHSNSSFIDPNDPVLTIQDYNAQGNQFCFDATRMVANKVYYVSYVIGECGPSGDLNLNDFCLRLVSKPVRFVPYPQADAGLDKEICFLTTNMEAKPSYGTGRWTVLQKPGGSNVVLSDPTASGSPVSVDQYGKYTLLWTEDNEGCISTDTVELNFHDFPLWRNVSFECDSVSEHYRMRFEIYGGDQSSYTLNGTVSGIQTTGPGQYVTPWIVQGRPVQVIVEDVNACQPAIIDTSYVCECLTEPGVISADDVMCAEETTVASYSGGTLDPNDGYMFILHDGSATTIGNRIAVNTTGVFTFDATQMQLNKTYYITAVVGNKRPDGSIDETDRCFGQTPGIPVTWYEAPAPSISPSDNTLTCKVDVITLDGSPTKNQAGTGNLEYTWSTTNGVFAPGSDLKGQMVNITAKGTYKLYVRNAYTGCNEEVEVVIGEDRVPPIADAKIDQCESGGMRIDAGSSSEDSKYVVEWSGAGLKPQDANSRAPIVDASGWYKIKVTNTENGCVSYDSVEVRLMELFENLKTDISCYGANDGEINISGLTGGTPPYTISINNESPRPYNSTEVLTNLKPGTYNIRITDSNGCDLEQAVDIVEPELVDIKAKDDLTKEWGDDVNLDSMWYKLKGVTKDKADIRWYNENGDEINPFLENLQKTKSSYRVVVRDENGCESEDWLTIYIKVVRKVYVPNVIMPGENGTIVDNKKLYVYGRPGLIDRVTKFRIYDRWGEMIWESKEDIYFNDQGRSLEGWNGTFKSREVKPGVYVYYVEVAFKDLGDGVVTKSLSGDVTVVK